MDFEKDSSALEPDFIVQGDKVVYMSDAEQKRRVAAGWAEVAVYLARVFRGGCV